MGNKSQVSRTQDIEKLKRQEGKVDTRAEKLQVLSEEFAQAILFKMEEKKKSGENRLSLSQVHDDEKLNIKGMAEKATKNVMQEYFDKDQLNLLPKPIMNTHLLRHMKSNRELPIYGFK